MDTTTKRISNNRLLLDLPEDEYQRLLPHLEPVKLTHGRVLYEIDDRVDWSRSAL
jgi:hypothetical protein